MKKVCMICGNEVGKKDMPNMMDYSCNGAVVGPLIWLKGHPACIENVNKLVVLPNRMRVMQLQGLEWVLYLAEEIENQKKEVMD